MNRIAIVVGSTRPGRRADLVAQWVHNHASQRDDAKFEIVDLADYDLPLFDEPVPPFYGPDNYIHQHTKAWSAKISAFDGYVFVTPEYNESTSAALKNGLDFLYAEWNNKAAGFVSYGSEGGVRAVAQLRNITGKLKMASVQSTVALTLHSDFDDMNQVLEDRYQENALAALLDELVAWTAAIKTIREPAAVAAMATAADLLVP